MRFDVKGYLLKPVIRSEFVELFRKIWNELNHRTNSLFPNRTNADFSVPAKPLSEHGTYISHVRYYIIANCDKRISLDDAAQHVHISPNYFSSLFKRETGQNFIDYVNEVRIRLAMDLLVQSDEKISDISVCAGFSNFSYLRKIFNKISGVTPRMYQALHRAEERIADERLAKEDSC